MITLEHANTIATQLGLSRPSSRYTIRKVVRAHDIIRRHTELIAPIEFDGEIYRVPSQQIWFADERKAMSYKVRILKGFPSCDCPNWRHTEICFRGLPIAPYACKHGIAVMIMIEKQIEIYRPIIAVQTDFVSFGEIKINRSHQLATDPDEIAYLQWCEQRMLGGY